MAALTLSEIAMLLREAQSQRVNAAYELFLGAKRGEAIDRHELLRNDLEAE